MRIDIEIGEQSLICPIGSPPYDHANYFSFSNGYRCINMWLENLNCLNKTTGLFKDHEIEVDLYQIKDKSWVVVNDHRVPEPFLNDSPCFTGYYTPPIGLLEFMFEYYKWDITELYKYTDPEKYYARKGWNYDEDTGILSKSMEAKKRELKEGYTFEPYFSIVEEE